MNTLKKNLILINFTIPFLFTSTAFAGPSISTAIIQNNSIVISGTGFGAKSTSQPIKFTNFDYETIGQAPSGWDTPQTIDSLVNNLSSHSGDKSLDSSAINKTSDYFPRISWDMGETIPMGGQLYLSAWMYLDATGTTATGWNWKGPIITSSNSPYYWSSGETTKTAIGFAGFFNQANYPTGWYNTAGTIQYSTNNTATYNYCSAGNSWANDAFPFGTWTRVEWIFKTSSTGEAQDGSITVNQVGGKTPALEASGCITHGNTSDLWRYVSLPQGITNITGGTLNLKMYFDDVYIDSSIARVEICNSATWATRTHCEIQPATAWAEGEVIATYNGGTLTGDKYAYIVGADGAANSDGVLVSSAPSSGYDYLRLRANGKILRWVE